jgi:hypothetical protein
MNLSERIAAAAALYDPTLMNELHVARPEPGRRWRNPPAGEGGVAISTDTAPALGALAVAALRIRVGRVPVTVGRPA